MASARFLGLGLATACVAFAALVACGSDDDGGTGDLGGSGGGDGGPTTPPTPSEFGLDSRPSNTTCKAVARPPSTAPVKFERVFDNVSLAQPMMLAQIPGDSSRWFAALRGSDGGGAKIVSFPSSSPPNNPTVVGSVAPLAHVADGEGGLLGFAFHPKFAQNGRLYVTFVTTGGANGSRSMVGYLTSTDNGGTFGDFKEVLSFDQANAGNHKGGGIAFGKDGYLYLSFGDGGGGDDTFVNGQTKTGFFSKLLRIDVDNVPGGQKYGVPDGNPFKNGGGEPAVFAYGLRNPFRFSIDRETNEVWIGDVGQDNWEEIDAKVKAGGNYGWPCREGFHDKIKTAPKCPSMSVSFVEPVAEYEHTPGTNGRSITGGVVYRGKAIPAFVGTYLYADEVKGTLWSLSFDPTTGESKQTQLNEGGDPSGNWVHFAEDNDGEVYAIAINNGGVYKLVAPEATGASTFPDRLSKTGCVDSANPQKPAAGLVPYGVNSPLWSDGAQKDRFVALPDGQNITVNADGDFDFPNGTVLVKTFSLGGKKVETRLFMRHDDGGWAGYTYEWLDDQSDAVLLPSSKSKVVGNQTWHYPSRSECANCHSEAAGRSLGLELGQLNGDYVYPSTNRISNQLKTLEHIGMFASALGKPVDQIIAYPDPLGTGDLEQRARSYLHSNCANCHRPEGQGGGDMDLRFATSLAATKTCSVPPQRGDLGVAGAQLLAPGAPETSILALRPHSPAANRMPPLASSIVDDQGVTLLDAWIRSLKSCP